MGASTTEKQARDSPGEGKDRFKDREVINIDTHTLLHKGMVGWMDRWMGGWMNG